MRPMTAPTTAPRGRGRARPDPAPSRLAYRMQRLALTPSVRRGFTFGMPLFAVALIGTLAFADRDRRDAVRVWVNDVKADFQSRDAFMVKSMAIDGASDGVAAAIRGIVPLAFPVSSFEMDLREMQARVMGLDAVEDADLRVKPGGVLEIRVAERVPAFVWRAPDGLQLVDATGQRVAGLTARADRADLPLISGLGADRVAEEAGRLIRASRPVAARIRGLQRIGERRWDMILADGQKIKLPEKDPVRALEQVIAVDEAQDLFARDVVLVDMRNPRRPTVRLAPETARALRQVKLTELGDD
ncbi:cell division protein FtsQ/DivIB [Palleronia rufa]|uniref:cell division protein FtsQ/DivIB n=2 Tax=Palleronia rufa TaxID=1530186 RepID=UPI00068D6B3B